MHKLQNRLKILNLQLNERNERKETLLAWLAKIDIFGWLPGIGTKINKTFFLWRGLCWVSRGRDFAQIDYVLAHDLEFWYSNPNCEIIARVFIDLEFFRILTRQLLFWFYSRLREW